LENASQKQIESIKKLILEKVQNLDIDEDFLLSKYLSEQLNKEYSNISKDFLANRKHYFRTIFYSSKNRKSKRTFDLSRTYLSQIADKLGYKTVQHLSQQFKKTQDFRRHNFKNSKEKETSY
jgi:AraC-like DNA-binding protein